MQDIVKYSFVCREQRRQEQEKMRAPIYCCQDSLRREALPSTDGTPSPRVAELMKNFDWDSNQLLSLVCVTEGACGGAVSNDTQRFCGKYKCVAISHQKGAKTMPPGWYISAGSTANGFFVTPTLSLQAAGGPITSHGATMLTDGDPPFRLNRAQWVFLMEGWDPAEKSPGVLSGDDTPDPGSWDEVFATLRDDESGSQSPIVEESRKKAPPLTIEVPPSPHPVTRNDQPDKVMVLEHMVRALSTRLRDVEGALTRSQENAEQARKDVMRLTQHILAIQNQDRTGSDAALAERMENLSFELLDPQGRFARLKGQVILLRERQESGGGVELNGVRFPARKSMLAWYEERDPPVGIFMDAHAMLHAIAPAVSSTSDTMRFLESQRRVEQSTGLESAVTTSFHTIVPSVFIGSSKNVEGGVFAALKASMKDYNAWKPAQSQSTGVAKRIKDGVAQVDERITMLRGEEDDSEVIRISNTLATDSMVFCTRLCSFLEEQQVTYMDGTGYSAATVWDMQLECLQTILEELHNARIAVIDAARHRPGLLLWGMIQAWKVQKRYMSNNFGDDPALTGILVRRLIMQGDDKGSQTKKVDELQKIVNEHQRNNASQFKKINDQLAKGK
jgi:uncharacterized protein YneF (UPF0154 family)